MAECLLNGGGKNNGVKIDIINFFISKGLSPNQALGICANVFGESSYIPTRVNPTSGAYGLFQWYDTRKTAFFNYCNKNGVSKENVKAQLDFCWHENYRNFTNYYLSNKDMKAHQSLIWWRDNWEVCDTHPNDGKDDCATTNREQELNKLVEMYKSNVKTEDCSVDIGSGSSYSGGNNCDDVQTVWYDNSTGNTPQKNPPSGFNLKYPFAPFGRNPMSKTVNDKPVIFGGSWAFKASPYMFYRGYLSYASWKQRAFRSIPATKELNKGYYGLKENYLNHDMYMSTADYVKKYLSEVGNKPKYIVVLCGLNDGVDLKKNSQLLDFELFNGYCEIFNAAPNCRVYAVSFGKSYINNEWYKFFNKNLKKAVAACAGHVRYIDMEPFCNRLFEQTCGNEKPGNGFYCENGWKYYAAQVMQYISDNESNRRY